MPTLVIGNKNYSSWSLRPWLLLCQFGVPFDERRLVLDTSGLREKIGQFDAVGKACRDALFALPALQEWIAAARAESERLPKYEKHA